MTAKEYLQQGYRLNEQLVSKLEQMEMLRALAERTTQTISDMPRGSQVGSKMEEAAVRLADMERLIGEDYNRLLAVKQGITKCIKLMPYKDAQFIFEQRYLTMKSWPDIAQTMHYDIRQVHRIHSKGLQWMDENLKDVMECH